MTFHPHEQYFPCSLEVPAHPKRRAMYCNLETVNVESCAEEVGDFVDGDCHVQIAPSQLRGLRGGSTHQYMSLSSKQTQLLWTRITHLCTRSKGLAATAAAPNPNAT